MKTTVAPRFYYSVEFLIVVDHPEMRDSSFMPVPAGHKVLTRWQYRTQGAAVREFESMLRGQWDFASEYVAHARVLRHRVNGLRSPAVVRRRVERKRA